MKYNDIFEFGKYKGFTYNYVFRHDAQYIWWCVKNIPNFSICQTHKKDNYKMLLSEIKEQRYLRDVEIELYKGL